MIFLVGLVLFIVFFRVESLGTVIHHSYTNSQGEDVIQYYIDYNYTYLRPNQVYFAYTCDEGKYAISHTDPDRPGFRSDPELPSGEPQAVVSDYTNSGYDKGHLGTATFFSYNDDAYYNTFYLTNVAPQVHKFNDNWYLDYEKKILEWTNSSKNCIDNVIFDIAVVGDIGKIGKDNVVVPAYYVSTVCEPNTGESVCLYGKNVDESSQWVTMASVSDCEKMFSFQFFTVDLFKDFPKCKDHKGELDKSFWAV